MQETQTAVAPSRRPLLWYCTAAASVLVGIVPIWILETSFGVSRKIIVGWGILAFIIGTAALKVPLHILFIERVCRPRLANGRLAAVHGLVSAACELGAAAAFFVYVVPQLTFWQLVGFGVGAGACEAIIVPFMSNPFKGSTLEQHAGEVYAASAGNAAIQWLGVVERAWAMLLQVATRGLMFLGIVSGNPLPALTAIVVFAACDGAAYYWHLRKVRFDSVPVLLRVHAYLALLAALSMSAFLQWSAHIPLPG